MRKYNKYCAAVIAASALFSGSAIADEASQTPVLSPYSLSPEQIAILDTDVPVLDLWEGATNRNILELFGAIDIDATPEQIWAIMTDCDMQLKIIPDMKKCIVKDADIAAGWDERLQVVSIGALLPRVRSKFRSDYTPYREIKITRTGGDLSILDGLWRLSLTQDGQTRVTYRARLKPKLPVPRSLMRKGTRKDMPEVLRNLRDLAESFNAAPNDATPDAVIQPPINAQDRP